VFPVFKFLSLHVCRQPQDSASPKQGRKAKLIVPKGWNKLQRQSLVNVFDNTTWSDLSKAEEKSKPKAEVKAVGAIPFFLEAAEPVKNTLWDSFKRISTFNPAATADALSDKDHPP